jgi:small subunit ribosomal protein S6
VKTYETLFIIKPDLEESETTKAITIIQDVITAGGGTISKVDQWGKRPLAYEIQKKREGYYVLLYFQCPPTAITELNRRYKLTDTIIRHMVIQLPEKQVEEILRSTSRLAESTLAATAPAPFVRHKERRGDAGDLGPREGEE